MRSLTTFPATPGSAPPWANPDQNLSRPLRETESTRQMSCDVVFGSPSADCRGTGVCRITARSTNSPSAADRKKSCKNTTGLLFPIEGGAGFSMVLTRAMLCATLYKTHLRQGTLTLKETFVLPEDLIKALGLKIKEIPTGKYEVIEAQGFLRIDFGGTSLH